MVLVDSRLSILEVTLGSNHLVPYHFDLEEACSTTLQTPLARYHLKNSPWVLGRLSILQPLLHPKVI